MSGAPGPLSAFSVPTALGTLVAKVAGQQPQSNPYAGIQTSGFEDVADQLGQMQAARSANDAALGIAEANQNYGIGEEALGDLGTFPGGIKSPGSLGWGPEGWASTSPDTGRSMGGFGSNTLGGGYGQRGTEGDFGSTTANTPSNSVGNPDSPFGGSGGPSGGNSDTSGTADSTGGSRGGEGPGIAKGGVIQTKPGVPQKARFGEGMASQEGETGIFVPEYMKAPGIQGNELQVVQGLLQALQKLIGPQGGR
jgi:hypothetical protein